MILAVDDTRQPAGTCRSAISKPYAYLGLAVWTALVVTAGLASVLAAVYLGPKVRYGGVATPGSVIGMLFDGLFFLSAISCAPCVVPAFIGYTVGALRAERGHPAREIPRKARSKYACLCGGILCAVVVEMSLFWLWRKIATIGDGLLIIILAVVGALIPLVLLVCSTVIGLRLARIGKATRHADAVCTHCGFAVNSGTHSPCPICGGEVCPTSLRPAPSQLRV